MDTLKRRFIRKGRLQHKVVIDNSEVDKIEVDQALLDDNQKGINEDNPFILPSKKRKTWKVEPSKPEKQPLNKKERRNLQQIVDRKEKKEKRNELLEALKKVQIPETELKEMLSTSNMHNRKKIAHAVPAIDTPEVGFINPIKGAGLKQEARPNLVVDSSSDCSITSDEDESVDDAGPEADGATTDTKVDIEKSDDALKDLSPDVKVEPQTTEAAKLEPPSAKLEPPDSLLYRLKAGVIVRRKVDIQLSRSQLPIIGEEQRIVETISENPVTIVCGETGSGKTTQVPQFLYEAGYTGDDYMIAVTEPRRVAAISMSKRVAEELNLSTDVVSYQIRYEGNVTPKTRIKFLTDGVLLKEIQQDFMMSRYRAVIVDEAHERSVHTDVLIGLLSRIVSLRHKRGDPLKLVIMSATLRIEDFRDNRLLFVTPPPVIKVEARQFPVTVHFNKRTRDDYLTEALKKICKIHRTLPEGGILVFVTGKQEIHTLMRKLNRLFPSRHPAKQITQNGDKQDKDKDGSAADCKEKKKTKLNKTKLKKKRDSKAEKDPEKADVLPEINLDSYSSMPADEQAEIQAAQRLSDSGSDSEGSEEDNDIINRKDMYEKEQHRVDRRQPLYTLPLYSLLPSRKQARVFQPPPEGCRLCVISTNVAETSITIPNVKYVIDSGMTKNKFYDKVTGVSTFAVTFTSQASADQRAGRAGRTAPGHCYRLYSSSVFKDEFEKFSIPEIVSRPVDDLILQMKAIGIEKCLNFPFPTPPSRESLQAAEDLLTHLGALEDTNTRLSRAVGKADKARCITELGRTLSLFPVAPRYAKMLSIAHQSGLLEYVVAIVSALSVQELFLVGGADVPGSENPDAFKEAASRLAKQRIAWAGQGESALLGDVALLLKAVGAAEFSASTWEFCEKHSLRYKAMAEVRKLRVQLTNIVNCVISDADICVNPNMPPPSPHQIRLIRQVLLAGLGDRVARLNEVPMDVDVEMKKKYRHSYQSTLVDDLCYIHPNSVLFKKDVEFVVFQEIIEANDKVYLKGVTAIEPEWIARYCASRCRITKPAEGSEPRYDRASDEVQAFYPATFGPHSWQLTPTWLAMPNSAEKIMWFAKFLLEGQVLPSFKEFENKYLFSPSNIMKSWARLKEYVRDLLQALHNEDICTGKLLTEKWKTAPKFLQKEVLAWLPESLHEEVQKLWPLL